MKTEKQIREEEIHHIGIYLAWKKLVENYGVDTKYRNWVGQLGHLWAVNAGTMENLEAQIKEEDFESIVCGAFFETDVARFEAVEVLNLVDVETADTYSDANAKQEEKRVIGFMKKAKEIAREEIWIKNNVTTTESLGL